MRKAVGRADLARMLDALPPGQAVGAASLFGFFEREERAAEGEASAPEPGPPPAPAPEPPGGTPFLRVEVATMIEPETRAHEPGPGLTRADHESPGRSLFAMPQARPLAPWSRLWPTLRAALQAPGARGEPDVAELLRAWQRGLVVRRLPRRKRPVWSQRAVVWVDRRASLVPCWSDQGEVCDRLRRIYGRGSLVVRYLDGPPDPRGRFRLDPSVPLLVLGDLGMAGSEVERAAWLAVGRRLQGDRARALALVPLPRARWDRAVAHAWAAEPWERGRRHGGSAARQEPRFWQERALRLLRLLAPAVLVQPGLLRDLRALLPPWQADAATELDVWSHPDVRAADATGMMLHAEAAERLRGQFATDVDPGTQAEVSATLRRWHGEMPQELLRAETLVWHALAKGVDPPATLEDARAFAERLAVTLLDQNADPEGQTRVRRYGRNLLAAMPIAAYRDTPSLKVVWAASFEGLTGARVPAGLDPGDLTASRSRAGAGEPRPWAVRQVGPSLVLSPAPGPGWPSDDLGPGSPVASIRVARPTLFVKHETDPTYEQHVLQPGKRIPLRPGEGIELLTDAGRVVIAQVHREPWACAQGCDRFGLWAEIDVEGAVQRFRWIPPGSFRMGSPKNEAGRVDHEGPQHLVTWTEGRWIADTPVTQALWEGVMGTHPSRIRSPDRPAENVSWEECQTFVERINRRIPGLQARLPTEAEWEYACRAGTTTATWLGDLEILGANNAPILDSIAWYGGNCGIDFDLKEGYDTTNWLEKQHPHTRGGTHPVGRKAPNPWGLYDMLGNVYEWCLDQSDLGGYSEGGVVDPPAATVGSVRVFRGGSWYDSARYVRAAYRGADRPGVRYDDLGFRLARGQTA